MLAHRRPLCALVLLLAVAFFVACAPPADRERMMAPNHLFRPTRKAVVSSPVAYDLNQDGILEIAVGSWDGYVYLMDSELRDLPGWPKYSRRGYFSSPALADLTGDGVPEVVIGSDLGHLYAWEADGQDVPGFPVKTGYRLWASPAILEDGSVLVTGRGLMYMVDRYGRPVLGWPQYLPDWGDSTPAVGPDLIAVATLRVGEETSGSLCAWHLDGTPYPWSPLPITMDSDSSPAIADLDQDGRVEIVFGDDEGLLHVVDLDGRELAGFPQRAQSLIEGSPAVADLDGDGFLDIAVGSWDGRLYVWNHRGQALPGWPIQVGDHVISSPALVDLDGDDRLDIIVGSKDTYLYGWTASGQVLPGFPYALDDHVHSSPWVGDLEGDGRADIVVGANNGIHVLRDVGPLGRQAWPMFHRNAAHTGSVP